VYYKCIAYKAGLTLAQGSRKSVSFKIGGFALSRSVILLHPTLQAHVTSVIIIYRCLFVRKIFFIFLLLGIYETRLDGNLPVSLILNQVPLSDSEHSKICILILPTHTIVQVFGVHAFGGIGATLHRPRDRCAEEFRGVPTVGPRLKVWTGGQKWVK